MKKIAFSLVFLINSLSAFGHGNELHNTIRTTSLSFVIIGTIVLILTATISFFYKKKKHKRLLFTLYLLITASVTSYLIFSTIYLTAVSETKGPVHWHTDFEIYVCDEPVYLIDPTGLTNRIGTPVLHEHGDNRIHIEGVVVDKKYVTLSSFFEVIGGNLTKDQLSLPSDKGQITIKDGELCKGEPGEIQVFKYSVTNPETFRDEGLKYKQEKLEDITNYKPAPYTNVPPGDCIIIEFGEPKNHTEHLCETYENGS